MEHSRPSFPRSLSQVLLGAGIRFFSRIPGLAALARNDELEQSGDADIVLLEWLSRKPFVVVRQQNFLAVDHSFENHFVSPQALEIREGSLGVFELQVAPVMIVFGVENPVMAVVGILNLDDRDTAHPYTLEEHFFDLTPALFV